MATTSSRKSKSVSISFSCAEYLYACAALQQPDNTVVYARGRMKHENYSRADRQKFFMEIFDTVKDG